ncbi:hypothetical protein F5Y00DRAFT_181470 [Daldinia vernicosa]|uniref:uncharacterized protein n=1 Tax=Daldinia vernicosa TaxID=114800 RepID=UPI00200789FB|nr:uncharacterized protein F5Y00DRAFT_181470 [Daldinia vernicosa]KAI0845057.1 hypothetical protein F5Y00DRAFT_181470 [Daldinia vernicosa]
MVVKLDAHQTSLEPFGLPWSSCHARHSDDDPSLGNSSRSRYFRISASAPNSPPSVVRILKAGVSGGGGGGSETSSESKSQDHANRRVANSSSRLTKIQVELQPCKSRVSTAVLSTEGRPKPKKANSAPVVLQSQSGTGEEAQEEHSIDVPPTFRVNSPRSPVAAATLNAVVPSEEGKERTVFCFPREAFVPSSLALRPPKRGRALHDVDGPGTGSLPCKKRRLRLHLVTSRLSQPYSWPATHILNRESGDDSPVLNRFLKLAAIGSLKKAGHQSALIRKAAILNRVRIGVRQAAVLRGHTVIAGMAARGNSLSHGLQLVTTSNSSTGARFPGHAPNPYDHPIPPAWRPHTTSFHPSSFSSSPLDQEDSTNQKCSPENRSPSPPATCPSPPPRPSVQSNPPDPPRLLPPPPPPQVEDDDVAFPSPDLETRYADFSDDDLDDVYADFGVLFGSGMRSPEDGSGSSETTSGEHFYEEYLDELDGIRWIA